jgi:hypothetical protein
MERETNRFLAVSDDGEEFVVIEYQHIIERKLLSGEISVTKGRKRLALSNGLRVNQIDPETFLRLCPRSAFPTSGRSLHVRFLSQQDRHPTTPAIRATCQKAREGAPD